MAGTNRIQVILDAIDKLSPVLNRLGSSTQGLGAGAVFMGNLYTKAFEAAAGAAGKLVDRFGEASDMQNSTIGLAGQFSAMTGKSYEAAGQMIKGMTAEFSAMAAKLPGATQDYKNLGLAISDTLIKANTENGVFNEAAFKKQTMSLTQTLGLLKATNSELTTTDIQLFFTKFSEGASASELQILKLNERMPGLMGELEKASKKLYGEGKKMEDLTLQQRTKIMEVATRGLAPPEMIRDLEKTASAQIESFKTTLFDQDTGIFGFLRSIKTVNGQSKTVMDGFAALLIEILGPAGLFAAGGKVLSAVGLNMGDPMVALYDGLMILTSWARKSGDFLRSLTLPNLTKLSPQRLGDFLESAAKGLFDGLGAMLSRGVALISGIDFTALGGNLGAIVGTSVTFLVATIRDAINNGLKGGFFSQIGETIAAWLNGTIGFLSQILSTTDWGMVGEAVMHVAIGLLASIRSFILSIDYISLAALIGKAFLAIIEFGQGLASGLFNAIGAAIQGIIPQIIPWISSRVQDVWESLKSAIGEMFNQAGRAIQNTPIGAIGGAISGAIGKPVGNNAGGLNFGSLFSAIARESSLMPAGAGVTIANTSEAILNRSQQSDLVSLVSSVARSRSTGATFAPQISVTALPGMDVNALAAEVMRAIEGKWTEFQATTL